MSSRENEETVLAVHHVRLNALVAGNLEKLDRLVSDDLIYTSPTGHNSTKSQVFDAFRSGALKIDQMESDDVRVRVYGDVAVVTYRARTKMRHGETMTDGAIQSTATYVIDNVGWRLVSQHSSRIE